MKPSTDTDVKPVSGPIVGANEIAVAACGTTCHDSVSVTCDKHTIVLTMRCGKRNCNVLSVPRKYDDQPPSSPMYPDL